MKKLLTVMGGAILMFGLAFTASAQVDVGINVTPAAGTISLDAGEDFVLTVQATGSDASLVTALEVDHSFEDTLPEFTVYADAENPWGSQEAATWASNENVSLVYNEETHTWNFSFGNEENEILDKFIENGVTFYFVFQGKEGEELFGSMSPTTPGNTFAYTFAANETNVLSLSGFSNQTIRVGDSKTLNGALNLSNYGGEEVVGTQTLSLTSGDADGIEISTSTPDGGTMNPLGLALPFNFKCEGPCDADNNNDLTAGASASIPLDITVKALKQGTYTFNYVAGVTGSDPAINETFTITVNRKSTGSSGGGGGSRPSQNVDTSTTVSGDILVIDGKSYDLKNLNAQEETVVKEYFLKTIIALLQQIIALKMTQG